MNNIAILLYAYRLYMERKTNEYKKKKLVKR